MGFDWIWLLSVWQTGPAGQRVSRNNAGLAAGNSRRRCPTCARRTSPAPASPSPATPCTRTGRGRRPGPAPGTPPPARPAAACSISCPITPASITPGWRRTPNITSPARNGPGPGPAELHLGQAQGGRPAPGLRPRPVLPRLARRPPAQLRQPGLAGGHDRRAANDRRAVRRRALRHGHAGAAGRLRADLGRSCAALLAEGDTARPRAAIPASCSWPRSTGTWNGRCSSRGSTTPTTSGCTTGFVRVTPGRCGSTSTRGWITRTGWPGSWRTTTSRGRRPTFAPDVHKAAAVITFLAPGLRFFHEGQFGGRKKRISPHLGPAAGRSR